MRRPAFLSLASSLALLACSSGGGPAPPPPTLTLVASWDPTTTYTNGAPVDGPVVYRVYAGACNAEKLIGTTTLTTFKFPAGTVGCAYVTAVDAMGSASAPSNRVMLGVAT